MIVGVTHNGDGRVVQRLLVSTKLAIGLPPNGERNYPTKLDHFVFLSKKRTTKGVAWQSGPELTEHYGKGCREVGIVLIDDDIENIFPTSYAWWTAVERKCWGDGTVATRRTVEKPGGKPWRPCGNGCPELASGLCKTSGDLRFVLQDFPKLGSVCRIHTGSYRSIRQIHSAVQEIQSFTGRRLAGLTAKLVVRPEETAYFDPKDKRKKSTTIWALSLEVDGGDMSKLLANLTENARVFAETRRLLGGGRMIDVVEDEAEQASELAGEFYPADDVSPADDETLRQTERGGPANGVPAVEVRRSDSKLPSEGTGEQLRSASAAVATKEKLPSAPLPWEPEEGTGVVNGESTSPIMPPPAPPAVNASKPNGTKSGNSAPAKTAAVRGVVGPLVPDASGNTVRRNDRGVEYVVFTITQNGSAATVYCNRPELLPEIARHQGRQGTAQVTATGKNGHAYYVLERFLEG